MLIGANQDIIVNLINRAKIKMLGMTQNGRVCSLNSPVCTDEKILIFSQTVSSADHCAPLLFLSGNNCLVLTIGFGNWY